VAATLKDLAALVGVSVNTASRALKDKPDIGLATRQRVKEAAAALGYRPNLNARSLVMKTSQTIGLAVSEPDNPVRMEFCEKLRQLAEADGYRILTAGLSGATDSKSVIEDLLARGVDGLVIGYLSGILAEQSIGKILQDCHQSKLPVTVFGDAQTGLADCLNIDFAASCHTLTSHILQQNLIPVAFFYEQGDATRYQGYCQAMREHGKGDAIRRWPLDGHRLCSGRDAVECYLQQFPRPPEAIIAPNDLTAIGIIAALKEHGWRVPEDTAVAGFDNIEMGAYYDPPLTSIGFDTGRFAAKVWEILFQRLQNGYSLPAQTITLSQELTVRRSCP